MMICTSHSLARAGHPICSDQVQICFLWPIAGAAWMHPGSSDLMLPCRMPSEIPTKDRTCKMRQEAGA